MSTYVHDGSLGETKKIKDVLENGVLYEVYGVYDGINSLYCIEWLLNGKTHREDGPAVIFYEGTEYWYQHGYKHRENGPAITGTVAANNPDLTVYFLLGKSCYNKEQFLEKQKDKVIDLNGILYLKDGRKIK